MGSLSFGISEIIKVGGAPFHHSQPILTPRTGIFIQIQIYVSHWTILQQPPMDGWYKLLTAEEGDFYNVPVPEEGTDLVQLKSQMRVSLNQSKFFGKFPDILRTGI